MRRFAFGSRPCYSPSPTTEYVLLSRVAEGQALRRHGNRATPTVAVRCQFLPNQELVNGRVEEWVILKSPTHKFANSPIRFGKDEGRLSLASSFHLVSNSS